MAEPTIPQKTCPKCREPKSVLAFNLNKRSNDGRAFWCKSCFAAYHRNKHPVEDAPLMQGEEWRPVVGYEGVYSVSNYGRVRRDLTVGGARKGRILKEAKDEYGYPRATLCKNNRKNVRKVHHLVMAAFVGPLPEGLTVNHKDGCKTNNRMDNLEYMTFSENTRHAHRTCLMPYNRHLKLVV